MVHGQEEKGIKAGDGRIGSRIWKRGQLGLLRLLSNVGGNLQLVGKRLLTSDLLLSQSLSQQWILHMCDLELVLACYLWRWARVILLFLESLPFLSCRQVAFQRWCMRVVKAVSLPQSGFVVLLLLLSFVCLFCITNTESRRCLFHTWAKGWILTLSCIVRFLMDPDKFNGGWTFQRVAIQGWERSENWGIVRI